ncbi:MULTISPECIES: N-acetylmuramoyl-L-alanine amidase [Moorena]|uniref:N-acetylmuramoyl-L-alanine amidase n=2 Tax=Moorena producens TaxID=1155739 RepID=A0A1D9G258_MOOP1|nr:MULTISPECIES: N-acetylmuramoyl-L-alanine amidase [Moorena]NES86538.1 cell wall hydrolase [Moorena sp. SIO2B7]AOY81605.1 N-acetylmuramoyl-L-alanine amidase [Moorena producens JHB]EGJ31318.1 N-acetylmuramoyl-L-alanine amidase [Moorena producens 3L]NEP31035.1 cell wall hydrolase [Moorena sp. SIO3B2]NEP66315.1 cell wall hydrolase [Moorena sp. SIO3A5]
MGRIFISAGHGGMERGGRDPGAIAGGTTEAEEMIRLRDLVVPELRSRRFEVLSVPDELSLKQTIQWINDRARFGDVALEIHADAFSNPNIRGASAFYIFNNTERKKHAELMLRYLITRLPELPNRGAKPDTDSGVGRLAFCRDVILPSLLLEVGFLTNPQDRALLQNRRRDMARGIADGLAQWSSLISGEQPPDEFNPVYPIIDIKINNQTYDDRGVLINSNSYIPIDLADRLGVDLTTAENVRRVQYRGVVYVKAIELRDYDIFVGWDTATRTVILRSISQKICPGLIDRIMGHGSTSEVQLQIFLKNNNQNALTEFPDLPRLYREEASVEGVNYDIAFSQACVETNFLRFSDRLRPEQNNFGGLGAVTSDEEATFPSARIGVRAHIQHLKAYASQEPLVQPLVDPRFRFVTRGIAPLVGQLSGRWSADLDYGKRIIAVVRRLYEASNLV